MVLLTYQCVRYPQLVLDELTFENFGEGRLMLWKMSGFQTDTHNSLKNSESRVGKSGIRTEL